jgi:hypothetical protein
LVSAPGQLRSRNCEPLQASDAFYAVGVPKGDHLLDEEIAVAMAR